MLARIIEIQHGGHGVYAQTVDVIFVQPEEGIGNQVILHFVPAVVVDQRAPVRMRALAWIGMLVKMGSVELRETVGVAREVRGSPVQKNAQVRLVAAIDEFHELRGCAEAAGGGVIADGLVTPGAVKRMLHDGK